MGENFFVTTHLWGKIPFLISARLEGELDLHGPNDGVLVNIDDLGRSALEVAVEASGLGGSAVDISVEDIDPRAVVVVGGGVLLGGELDGGIIDGYLVDLDGAAGEKVLAVRETQSRKADALGLARLREIKAYLILAVARYDDILGYDAVGHFGGVIGIADAVAYAEVGAVIHYPSDSIGIGGRDGHILEGPVLGLLFHGLDALRGLSLYLLLGEA